MSIDTCYFVLEIYMYIKPIFLISAHLVIVQSYRSVGDLKARDNQRKIAAELQQRMQAHWTRDRSVLYS